MSPESGSREPVTEAGREHLEEWWPRVLSDPDSIERSDAASAIRRVESEAVSRFAEALRTAVGAVPFSEDGTLPDHAGPMLAPTLRDYRRRVLSEIERLSQAPADTGEGA